MSRDSQNSRESSDKPNFATDAMVPLLRKCSTLTDEDLRGLTRHARTPQKQFSELVVLIGNRFEVDVCSLYLLEQNRPEIVLAATVGLRQACVGNLRMALWQGLAGLVAQQRRTVMVPEAAKHARFKYFREAEEDAYQSFLGTPVEYQGVLQGVLVIQTVSAASFDAEEIRLFEQVADTISPTVGHGRRYLQGDEEPSEPAS